MNSPACSKLVLCIALLFGLTIAQAAPEISARKLGGLEIGFVGGNLKPSFDGKYLAMLSTPGERGSDCYVFERITHQTIRVPGSFRAEPLVWARSENALWVWGLHRDEPLPGVKNIPKNAPFIGLYDLPKRKFLRAFTGDDWNVPGDSALSQSGSTLIVSSTDGWARAFNVNSGKVRWKRRLKDEGNMPVSLTLSNDGSRFLHSDDEGETQSTQVVATRSGKVLQTLHLKLNDGLQSAFSGGLFAPRGDMVAVFQPDTQDWVFFDARTGKMQWKMGARSQNNEGDLEWKWSPDARQIAVFGPNGFALRDARSGGGLRSVDERKSWGEDFGSPAFSPDGALLYVLSGNRSGFGADNAIWQLRLRGTNAQIKADKIFMVNLRAEEERFALSPQHINQSLILAARGGDDRRVAFLLGKGANIETRDSRNETPLLSATFGNDVYAGPHRYRETVQILLSRGASVKRDGGFLLASAASSGNDELLRALFKRGVSANADATAYGAKTALEVAVHGAHVSSVQLLLKNGAKPGARSDEKLTPLLILAQNEYNWTIEENEAKIAQMLLGKGADINARTPTRSDGGYGNETALSRAAYLGKSGLVELFLNRGAEVNLTDAQGQTPLMKVAQYETDEVAADVYNARNLANRLKIVRALLAHGAKLELRDKEKQTAFDMATSPELQAVLKIPAAPKK